MESIKQYHCFRALDFDESHKHLEEIFEDCIVGAHNKEDARKVFARHLTELGCVGVEMSSITEEVYGTYDGVEVVYYGFDED